MMKKLLFLGSILLLGVQAQARDYKIDLGEVQKFEIIVSCPTNYNGGEINARSIIEEFNIIGSNEKTRNKISGCQANQSYALFVKNGELHIWKKWIDGDSNDEARMNEMRKHGSIALGKLDSVIAPECRRQYQWNNKVVVQALPGLKVVENIKKRSFRGKTAYGHNMVISDKKDKVKVSGWITTKVRARTDGQCYFK